MRIVWLYCILLIATFQAQAGLNSLASLSQEQLRQQVEGSDWYACGEGELRYCLDEFGYYRLSFYAELVITADTVNLTLLAPYSAHQLSEVQLNLRRDGFLLDRISIAKESFNVTEALRLAKSTKQRNQVDKALIQFLNRFPQEAVREMDWTHSKWQAILHSDGEMMALTLRPNLERPNDEID